MQEEGNEGRRPLLLSLLDSAHIAYKPIVGSWEVQLRCPYCDKPNHFYINVVKRVGFCHRCNKASGFRELVRVFGLSVDQEYAGSAPTVRELREVYTKVFGYVGKPVEDEGFPEAELPMGCIIAYRIPRALKYLLKRGITIREVFKYKILYCFLGRYRNRILFPIFWDDKLVGFIARTLKEAEPKYLFPSGLKVSKLLYPQENLEIGRLVITEGVIPAVRFYGVATFGKKLSSHQLQILIRSPKIRQVVLAWDRDAWFEKGGSIIPALEAWNRIRAYYPCIGLVLPEDAPQPDHLQKTTFLSAVETVCRKHSSTSAIYKIVNKGGRVERVL